MPKTLGRYAVFLSIAAFLRGLALRMRSRDTWVMNPTRAAMLTTLTASLWLGASAPQADLARCSEDAILVFDGSGSMDEIGFDTGDATRIEEARIAMTRALPKIAPFRRLGLLIYGPGPGGSCDNLDLRFGPIEDAAGPIIAAVEGLRPGGLTPLSDAVEKAAEALEFHAKPAVVVLVTDGNETCGGRPCALGARLAAQGADLTIHVIGFRVVVDFFSWNNPEQDPTSTSVSRCLADTTGGLFVSTETVDELVAALQETMGCALIGGLPAPARLWQAL
jgi:Ca-activated chloride channel family protein